jgi:hypothetical protein
MDALSIVRFGDPESLGEFLFENGLQHTLFANTLARQGLIVPRYPIIDVDLDNLDDWLQIHNQIHEAEARFLGTSNPFNLLDVDLNKESEFYDWLSSHVGVHELNKAAAGL